MVHVQATTDIPRASLLSETLISFSQAARRLPPCREGKPVNPSTPFRWAKNGIRRPDGILVRLEAVRAGGRWLTSVEALARFCERLSTGFGGSACTPDTTLSPDVRTANQRERASDRAAEELALKGL